MLRVVVCTEPPIQNVLIDTRRICIFIMASEFSWGRLTPQQVQKIANLAHLDHEGCKDWAKIHNMARIGESGHISGNAYRDLMRTLPPSRLPRAHKIKIPVQHKLLGRANPKLPFLFPHEVFASIYHAYPAAFYTVLAPPGEIERFWDEVAGDN
jgi:hypothetical protein